MIDVPFEVTFVVSEPDWDIVIWFELSDKIEV